MKTGTLISIAALAFTILGGFYAWAARDGATQVKLEQALSDIADLKTESKAIRNDVSAVRGDMNGVRSEILNWMANQDATFRRYREVPDDYVAPEARRRPTRNGGE